MLPLEAISNDVLPLLIMNVPNRYHHSKKELKPRIKPQAMRARKDALKALKRKLKS